MLSRNVSNTEFSLKLGDTGHLWLQFIYSGNLQALFLNTPYTYVSKQMATATQLCRSYEEEGLKQAENGNCAFRFYNELL